SGFAQSQGLTYDRLPHCCPRGRTSRRPGPRPKYAITLRPEQEVRRQHGRTWYLAPFAIVQRAPMVWCAFRHPEWTTTAIAQRLGCRVTTVQRWRRRGQAPESLREAPRAGTRRTLPHWSQLYGLLHTS